MPPGHPRLGMRVAEAARVRKGRITSAAEVLTEAPSAKLLGSLNAEAVQAMLEKYGEPPWESAARQNVPPGHAPAFVTVPAEWRLRWLNPKVIDQAGFRDWKTVDPTDSRVVVHVKQSIYPDNTIRRGGPTGDLLAWMPRHWYEARMREKQIKADRDGVNERLKKFFVDEEE